MEQFQRFDGTPQNLEGRTETEITTYQHLTSIGMHFEVWWHNAAFSMEECAKVEDHIGVPICKNLFLCNRQQTDFYLLMIPEDKPFKTKYLSSQIGCARLSFATGEMMEEMLSIHPGSLSPMGLINDTRGKVRLIIDSDLLSLKKFGCHPCVNTATLVIEMQEFLELYLPSVEHNYTEVTLAGE